MFTSNPDSFFGQLKDLHDEIWGPNESPFSQIFNTPFSNLGAGLGAVPPVEKYDACVENHGLSVWTKSGMWKCLFPRSVVDQRYGPENDIISKEDYMMDFQSSKSKYFENFNDYLNWRSQMKKVLEDKAKKWDEEMRKKSVIAKFDKDNGVESGDKEVIGTSLVSSFRTNEDGKIEKYTLKTKYFSDGTSQVEENTGLVGDKEDTQGWFWK